jgi:hypothetical protein
MTQDGAVEFIFDDFGPEEREDLLAEIDAAFADIRRGDYADELDKAGIAAGAVADAGTADLTIKAGQQMGPVEGAVVLIVVREGAKLGSRVFTDVWKAIILPRLRSRFGTRVRARKT